jgi:hypothetical protein
VVIAESNIKYPINEVFLTGKTLTNKQIDPTFFTTNRIIVIEFNYKRKISSSLDDLIGYFICVVLFTFLLKNGENPTKVLNGTQKLNMLTNDTQQFNKNLFGLTSEESNNREKIHMLEMKSTYKMVINNQEQPWINNFIKQFMTTTSDDTHHLSCLIINLTNKLIHNNKSNFPTFKQFKSIIERNQTCKKKMSIHCIYLYVLIKYVQNKLFDENMFGSFSKDKIIELFS